MDVPDDSDISDFEGEDGDDASDMFEPSADFGDSENSASEIEHVGIPPVHSSDSEGNIQRNENTTSTTRRSSRGRAHGVAARRARSRSPVNRHNANGSVVRWGNIDEDVVVSFPDFRGQNLHEAFMLFWLP